MQTSTADYYAPPRSTYITAERGQDELLAGVGQRFAAKIIDGLLMFVAIIPGVIIVMLDPNVHAGSDDPGPLGMLGSLVLLVAMLGLAAYQWFLISTRGQSIGKKVVGIHIRKVGGAPVDFVTGVVLRVWVIGLAAGVLNVITCGLLGWVVNLIDPLFIFGAERRCVHDYIAKTTVHMGEEPVGLRR